MSRRNFSQPSLADAFVNAYSRVGGFLEDIAKTFEWAAFGVLMGPLHSSSDGAPSLPAADHVQDRASPAMVRALGPWRGGSRARSAVVSALLRHSARSGDARPFLDLALPPAHREARPVGEASGRGQPSARRARSDRQTRHAGRRHDHRGGGEAAVFRGRRGQRARSRRELHGEEQRDLLSATRRIWRWTRRVALCAKRR